MIYKSMVTFLVMLAASIVRLPAQTPSEAAAQAQQRITKEVRHELLMLPYYNVFDNLSYKVDGDTVTAALIIAIASKLAGSKRQPAVGGPHSRAPPTVFLAPDHEMGTGH